VTTESPRRGRLKVFLGYAAGVGKTYQMLSEAHQMKAKGVDVVIGYIEPHGRKATIALSEGLETIPRKVVEYRGTRFEDMDTEAILRRHPQVAVVDEFPHTHVPGSPRLKRWEDVHVLLDAGIDVLTTMMLASIRRSLRRTGRLVLVEYRKEDPTIPISNTHRMSTADARAEIAAEGFRFDHVIEGLPRQHIMVFRRSDAP
jgi:two-component system sensor histidine kinase KdpD